MAIELVILMMVMLKVKMKLGTMWAKMMVDMKSEEVYQLLVKYLAIELVDQMMVMLKVKMKLGTMWAKLMVDTKSVMMMVTASKEVV